MITLLFNYCCSFLFIPGEATIPLRQSNARSYESNYAATDDIQTPIETVARDGNTVRYGENLGALVGPPFCYASPCAGFEPFVTR
jgi:hypothetical protein